MGESQLIEAAAAAMLRYEQQHGRKGSEDYERQRYPQLTADQLLSAHTTTWSEYRRLEHAVQARANQLRGRRLTDEGMDRRGTRRPKLSDTERAQILADVRRGVPVLEVAARMHCGANLVYKLVRIAEGR